MRRLRGGLRLTSRPTVPLLVGAMSRGGSQGLAALLVANAIGAAEWGLVATIQVAVLLAVQVTSSGSYVAQLRPAGSDDTTKRAKPPALLDLGVLAVGAGGACFASLWFFLGFDTTQILLAGYLGLVMSIGSSFEQITIADLIIVDGNVRVSIVTASRGIFVLVSAAIFVTIGAPGDATGWLICLCVVWTVNLATVAAFRFHQGIVRIPTLRDGTARNVVAMVSFGIGTMATVALRLSDQLLLAKFSGLAEVGSYALAARVVDLGVLAVAARAQAGHRVLAEQPTVRALVDNGLDLGRRVGIVAAAVVPLLCAAIVACNWVLSGYESFLPVGFTLAASLVPRGMFVALAITLLLAGSTRARNLAIFGALALNVGLNLVIVPRYGAMGAAVTTLVCETGLVVLLVVVLRRLRSAPEGRQEVPAVGLDEATY